MSLTANSPINPTLLYSGTVPDSGSETVFIGDAIYSKVKVYMIGENAVHITVNLPNSGGQAVADDAGVLTIIQLAHPTIGNAIFLAMHDAFSGVSQTIVRMPEDSIMLQPTGAACHFEVYAYKK